MDGPKTEPICMDKGTPTHLDSNISTFSTIMKKEMKTQHNLGPLQHTEYSGTFWNIPETSVLDAPSIILHGNIPGPLFKLQSNNHCS